jgi:hypothetical protein
MTKPNSAIATSSVKTDRLALIRKAAGEPDQFIKPNEPRASDRVPLDHRPLESRSTRRGR